MKYWTGKVPFDKIGMRSYEFYGTELKALEPFDDTLILARGERGRSAAHFIFKSKTTGLEYPMFMKYFVEMLKISSMANGEVSGRWAPIKRGANYGIALIYTL